MSICMHKDKVRSKRYYCAVCVKCTIFTLTLHNLVPNTDQIVVASFLKNKSNNLHVISIYANLVLYLESVERLKHNTKSG